VSQQHGASGWTNILRRFEEFCVLDIIFIFVTILFFVISIGYVAACEWLMK
jgi:hypothetical protein